MKIKNLVAAFTMMMGALASPFAANAAGGDIYEIIPVDGSAMSPDDARVTGQTIRFKIRLMARDFQTYDPSGNPAEWYAAYVGPGYLDPTMGPVNAAWYAVHNPLQIGIVVSGRLAFADIVETVRFKTAYTDIVCEYRVRPGDIAFPIRLAMKGSENQPENPIIAGTTDDVTDYCLNNLAYWNLKDTLGNVCNFRYCDPKTAGDIAAKWPTGASRTVDYDLSQASFHVKGLQFGTWDPEDPAAWRTVHQGSVLSRDTSSLPPQVQTIGVPTNSVDVYVWSEDETAVKIPEPKNDEEKKYIFKQKIKLPPDGATEKEVTMRKLTIVSGIVDYDFGIEGVEQGKTANLVLSAVPGYIYNKTGDLCEYYMTVPVKCVEPLPASVTVEPADTKVLATSLSYSMKATELKVAFTEPFGEDVTLTIEPELTGGTPAPNGWSDYIRFSTKPDEDVTLQAAPIAKPVVVIKAGDLRPSQFADGTAIADGKLYVYALRGDVWSDGTKGKVGFKVTTTNAQALKPSAEGGIDGWNKVQSGVVIEAQDPVIESMFDGTDKASAIADSPRTLQIAISDTWADAHCDPDVDGGYEIWIVKDTDSTTDTSFKKVEGLFKPGKGGVLFLTNTVDKLPTVVYTGEKSEFKSKLYVKSPISGNVSVDHAFTVSVKTPDKIVVQYDPEHEEGDEIQLDIHLEDADGTRIKNTQGDLYVYIQGETEADTAAINAPKGVAKPGASGIKFANYATSPTEKFKIYVLDGDASKSGSTFTYSVIFLKTPKWSTDPDDMVTVYKNNEPVVFSTHNVAPKVDFVSVAGGLYDIDTDGTVVPAKFPVGISQTFSVAVDEPGDLDKSPVAAGDRPFQVRWFFQSQTVAKTGPTEAPTDGIIEGNPDDTECTFDFPAEGRYTVTVELRDKDMGNKWGNRSDTDTPDARIKGNSKKFTFYVDVVDQPQITVHSRSPYLETSSVEAGGEAKIDVALDMNNCTFDMWVNLKIEPFASTGTAADGKFELQTSDQVTKLPDGTYNVLFPRGSTNQTILVQSMDGTLNSRTTGFRITPEMVEDKVHIVPNSGGKHPHEYYLGVIPPAVKVYNVAPDLNPELDVYPVPGTNAISVAAGLADEKITWSFTDVKPDFDRGITVEFKGGGGWGPKTYHTREEAMAAGATGFQPNFGGKTGPQTVKLIINDPDNGSTTVTWQYQVEDAKGLSIVAHGPATGYGASLSKRYRTASGLGEGRVWATSASEVGVEVFESSFNCGLAASWRIYGYGYKVGDKDNGVDLHKPDGFGGYTLGYYTTRDTKINQSGNNLGTGEAPYVYDSLRQYKDSKGNPCDSFLYTWLQMGAGKDSSSGATDAFLNDATSPEYVMMNDTGAPVTLPTEKLQDGTGYVQAQVEAVFSLEFLASDNMGDINADGIPDIYVDKYGLGVVDTVTGKVSGDDLSKVGDYNQDQGASGTAAASGDEGPGAGDFLPQGSASSYSTLIPGLPETWSTVGQPFTARLEIRGYDDNLNDAPENNPYTKVTGVMPDRIYLDPATHANSTLSPLEYRAWCDFAAANGIADPTAQASWKLWSPERPSDPTLIDTDGDGFPDGYEYYFWYRAHVGFEETVRYVNEFGYEVEVQEHRYLTGRAYDPRNPGNGRLISRDEIKRIMDPAAPSIALDAKTQDSDNDGLPDLLEFEIGTNPFDFDTDGDGLPDGFELLLGGTDPLRASTTKGVLDAMRNYDGDAMAFSTPKIEAGDEIKPAPKTVPTLYTFATVDPLGDTDGVQWYVTETLPTNVIIREDVSGALPDSLPEGHLFALAGDTNRLYISSVPLKVAGDFLAVDTNPDETWSALVAGSDLTNTVACLKEFDEANHDVATNTYVALMPTRLTAGTRIVRLPAGAPTTVHYISLALGGDVTGTHAAWVYGRDVNSSSRIDKIPNYAKFGMLAMGRYQDARGIDRTGQPVRLAMAPQVDDSVAYLHYMVYEQFGFDPRTAWNPNSPIGARWEKAGYAGRATRTRAYTLYDEFLLLSFFLNNGKISTTDVTATPDSGWEKIWSLYTTNGQGPNEPDWEVADDYYRGRTSESNSGENGADTDEDGVPDGWELYVMAGPKQPELKDGVPTGRMLFVFAGPTALMSPLQPDANKETTDSDADKDKLTERGEYAGTDSCKYYSKKKGEGEDAKAFSTTITRPDDQKEWYNKFFPTDPWNADTDGDCLADGAERGLFKYGKPVDDGKMMSIPGGGLNPLSVDTDADGLPDMWEAQFAGNMIYKGEDAQIMDKDEDGNEVADGNPKQGLCNGMDGTVWDAFTYPHVKRQELSSTSGEMVEEVVILDGVAQVVDRDYDHDGLENWQEYMVGAMRCWRYDDPNSPWDYTPFSAYFNGFGLFDLEAAMRYTGSRTPEEFWFKTLVDKANPYYNPHFVTDTSSAALYFSRVMNGWDPVYSDIGTYYMFPDRVNGVPLADIRAAVTLFVMVPSYYICTSPINSDTDLDGFDDYYELFHGMNPLLGAPGVNVGSLNPCDIVYDSCIFTGSAIANPWSGLSDPYDFTTYPWMNGCIDADPDGDDVRNQDESIVALVAPSKTWYHTDPTPLWMTDSSYDMSLTRLNYVMPTCWYKVEGVPSSIDYEIDGDVYTFDLKDSDGWVPMMGDLGVIMPFVPDYWGLAMPGAWNWRWSFEENEGFDTDHDGISDYEELQGKYRSSSDPQDSDSPRRRQAMYFQGPENPSALQTLPCAKEAYPRAATQYPTDMSLLQYTVECWVRPESAADATVIERGIFTGPSHQIDEQYIRCNFRIAIKNGKWYTKFDSNGTLANQPIEVMSERDVALDEWTYVAATYDANVLTLYVNGETVGYVKSSLKPAWGASAVVLHSGDMISVDEGGTNELIVASDAHTYWFNRSYELHAFLIGASFRDDTSADVRAMANSHVNVLNGQGWKYYKDFFKGYVDEVRVWDGAQDSRTISENYRNRVRFTREDALNNRSEFYSQWKNGQLRYNVDGDGNDVAVVPELLYHWAFDSLPGAENDNAVMVAPNGFRNSMKAKYSTPAGYRIAWWQKVLAGYGSVYAGDANWVPWVPNTVSHLPRFDGSTLDSAYWTENSAGIVPGTYKFARTAEPVTLWTQYLRNGAISSAEFQTTSKRYYECYNTGTNGTSTLYAQFEFTGRHLTTLGEDLLPLGGAFAKYVDEMWDGSHASKGWEHTGTDNDNDGLPDWWQAYADQNYREGLDPLEPITWDTMINYQVGGATVRITAGQAYMRDVAKGVYVDAKGEVHPTKAERAAGIDRTKYEQTAMTDGMIPDWWKELWKIDDAEPLFDSDNDGLNNYVEYVASELFPFRLNLDPLNAKTQEGLLDYFRRVGSLYVGEMFTDHDMMEDEWERGLGDESVASANLWDALKDKDEDGWTNFAENRQNGYTMSTLGQLVSHAVSDAEVLDAPIPTIKLTVRYNGNSLYPEKDGEDSGTSLAELSSGDSSDGTASIDIDMARKPVPNLIVQSLAGAEPSEVDATWILKPGETVSKSVYLGGWQNRVVRGAMGPGNVDIFSLDLKFRQITQSDLYTWWDPETGLHQGRPYKEFKAAVEKNPDIINNVQIEGGWSQLDPVSYAGGQSDKAVTVSRDELTQFGYIAVYGLRVGTVNLTTGEFEIDMQKIFEVLPATYEAGSGRATAWSTKEAIFKLDYAARIPSAQVKKVDMTLGVPDEGFMRGGKNTFIAFYDSDNDSKYTPGEPFGILRGVDVGWAGRELEIELTDTSAVTPRIDLWAGTNDRDVHVKGNNDTGMTAITRRTTQTITYSNRIEVVVVETTESNKFAEVTAPAPKTLVSVSRSFIDGRPVAECGLHDLNNLVFLEPFENTARRYLCEGDFLKDGAFDLDWANLNADVMENRGVWQAGCEVTNVTYLVAFDRDSAIVIDSRDTNTVVETTSTFVTRRFEKRRTVPTPCLERTVFNVAQPTFSWKIENEDLWASKFGTTYTAFKVIVKDLAGNLVYDSGIRRLPAQDVYGVYNWTAPIYVGSRTPQGALFANLANYTWQVALYNAKFSTDKYVALAEEGDPFSKPEQFRMNATTTDRSSGVLTVAIGYAGPATHLDGRIRVQAFESPDFTGDPASEITVDGLPTKVTLLGLPAGEYFVRAFIDTNRNGTHEDWESWGYLTDRDTANSSALFNPIKLATTFAPAEDVRTLFIEDCDTDGDWFPDVWEAEQNGDVFDRAKIAPITGDADLPGVNPNLQATLAKGVQASLAASVMNSLATPAGVAVLTGVSPSNVKRTPVGFTVDASLKDGSFRITGLEFDTENGVAELTVAAATEEADVSAAEGLYPVTATKSMTVTLDVYHTDDLAGDWTRIDSQTVTIDGSAKTVTVNSTAIKGQSGFFKAEIK